MQSAMQCSLARPHAILPACLFMRPTQLRDPLLSYGARADTVTGVAIGFSHFHHPMTQKKFRITGNPDREQSDMSNQKPFDMPAMHIFKIWGGQLHEIEAIGIVVPLDSPTGWE